MESWRSPHSEAGSLAQGELMTEVGGPLLALVSQNFKTNNSGGRKLEMPAYPSFSWAQLSDPLSPVPLSDFYLATFLSDLMSPTPPSST